MRKGFISINSHIAIYNCPNLNKSVDRTLFTMNHDVNFSSNAVDTWTIYEVSELILDISKPKTLFHHTLKPSRCRLHPLAGKGQEMNKLEQNLLLCARFYCSLRHDLVSFSHRSCISWFELRLRGNCCVSSWMRVLERNVRPGYVHADSLKTGIELNSNINDVIPELQWMKQGCHWSYKNICKCLLTWR